ncbi:TetR family transcriptional regulator [Corynebacterium testudinoris]|uniref:Transcriptional regulator, TetR family n=1 Tax=Corynebacterium testudinoris TaxID=136857 RepID=A0A0G3H6F6_9CORY|nr:TetR/AcrR family transcriptional regulator [Corynebacterium testudinoris]AKK08330.1 transcriptional regulator, TetR family [Corynebacterium testudinoris]MBX8995771.1 TetR family transcriptional regulator [Corynebacterium testudinoris]
MNNDKSRRELKRARTRRRIEDAATALVVKHGFDNITIDDICLAADISRRSFFNYMESKDEAVLGHPRLMMSDDRRAEFVAQPSANVVATALDYVAATLDDLEAADMECGAEEEFLATLKERRHQIMTSEPSVALLSLNRFREQSAQMQEVVMEHLEAHPGDRILQDEPLEVEASIINGLVREAIWLQVSRPCPTTDRTQRLRDAGATITTLTKELTW